MPDLLGDFGLRLVVQADACFLGEAEELVRAANRVADVRHWTGAAYPVAGRHLAAERRLGAASRPTALADTMDDWIQAFKSDLV